MTQTETLFRPKQSLSQSVYARVVERIFAGEYRVGERLPTEEELARIFDVSRMTVRQALSKLRSRRLLVSLQGSGNYVGGLPLSDAGTVGLAMEQACFGDMFDFRVGLEAQAAALAAQNRTESNIENMRDALQAHELSGEPSLEWLISYRIADLEFHEAIAEASTNPILIKLLGAVNPLFTMRWMSWKHDIGDGFRLVAQQVINEHAMIMNAIIARDSDMARVAMQFHLKHAQQRIALRRAALASKS